MIAPSNEAEQSVLGALLLESEHAEQILSVLTETDFLIQRHQVIYHAICELAKKNSAIDMLTVSEHCEKLSVDVGGIGYLASLMENAVSLSNVAEYAEVIKERSARYKLATIASDINEMLRHDTLSDSKVLIDQAETMIMQLTDTAAAKQDFKHINDVVKQSLRGIDERFNSEGALTGLSTGLTELDGMTSGLQSTDLIILAARPSMGKSTFAMNLVEHAVINQDKAVAVFSIEMPDTGLADRSISSLGRLDASRVRSGKLEQDDWAKLSSAVNQLNDRPLYIDDSSDISPADIRSKLRRLKRKAGDIGLIMIDYLQMIKIPGFTQGRVQEITEISRQLKSIAKEFNCPLVALSQLNRSLENRPNKRPINSDLRESGAIEQDADLIMFLYRDEVYDENSPDKGTAEVIIGKQRNGPIGMARVAFIGKHARFDNLDIHYAQNI
jgi:replicative DNA helicase